MHLRLLTTKFRQFQFWEPKNLRYITSIFIFLNIIPQDTVICENGVIKVSKIKVSKFPPLLLPTTALSHTKDRVLCHTTGRDTFFSYTGH